MPRRFSMQLRQNVVAATTVWAKLQVFSLLVFVCGTSTATEFSAKIVDGLDRPVQDAVVVLYWLNSISSSDVRRVELLTVRSDEHGMVRGTYDDTLIPANDSVSVYVGKDGYGGYHYTRQLAENVYVLKREFSPADFRRILDLAGDAKLSGLREILIGNLKSENLYELVFFNEHELRPFLRTLVQEAKVGTLASQLLAFIGVPEDMRHVVRYAPEPKRDFLKNRWAYGVVCALLDPSSEQEWAFLRRSALNEFDDWWVDRAAIMALKLIASPRSLAILKEAKEKNLKRERLIASAIEYAESGVAIPTDKDLVEAGKMAAHAVRIGNWMGNQKPRFNRNGNMALIDFEFIAGRDRLIYTGTFHRVGDVWKLRGVRETMQALLPYASKAEPVSSQK